MQLHHFEDSEIEVKMLSYNSQIA